MEAFKNFMGETRVIGFVGPTCKGRDIVLRFIIEYISFKGL